MATRVYHASDNSGGNTTTQSATVYTDHRTLTFTPDASSSYLLLAYCESQIDNNDARDTQVIFEDATTPTQLRISSFEMNVTDATEWAPCSFATVVTFGGSPTEMTYKIKHKMESTVTNGDSVCRNGSIVALKLAAADAFMTNDGAGTSTSNPGAWTDYNAASGDDALIFTPGSTGDYLILAWARTAYSATSNGAQIRLLCEDGTTAVASTRWCPNDSTALKTYAAAVKRTSLAASSQTFKLQHARTQSGAGTSTLAEVTMVALRLDGFEGNTATQDTGADTTTSATYVDLGDTRADTLTSGIDYLLLATADFEMDTLAAFGGVKLTDGTNTYAEVGLAEEVGARGRSLLVPRIVTGTGASVTHKFQGISNGTATLSLDEHRLFVLQVEAAAGGDATASPATVALTLAQPAATAQAGSTVSPSTAALTLAQPAVTAAGHATPAPATAALALAQPAVEAQAGSSPAPATAALVLAQPAVTAQAGSTVSPATAALTLAQPAVTAAGHATPEPATVALVLAQPPVTASGSGDATASPAATALTLTQPAVTAQAGSTAEPATAALTLTQPAVTAQAGSTTSPATAALTLTQPAVEAQAGATPAPATAALTLAQPAVEAQAGSTSSPATAALTLSQPAVTAQAGATLSPATVALPLTQPAVTPQSGSTVTSATVVLVLTQPPVTATATNTASPATVVLVVAIPTVTATGNAIVAGGARMSRTRTSRSTVPTRALRGGRRQTRGARASRGSTRPPERA